MDKWNPGQYSMFANERSRPFWDLAAMVPLEGSLLDIGCGTGELTAELHSKRASAGLGSETLGIDSSQNMLSQAHTAAGLYFEQADVATWEPGRKFDVVFSNACLQWVDDHVALFQRVWKWTGKYLAVQMPANFDHVSHALADEMARRWSLTPRQSPVLAPELYARLMDKLGARDVNVHLRVYLHHMDSGLNVVEWVKGTLLTYYEKQLSAERYAEFLAEYTAELSQLIGTGPYLYTFKRLFISGRKSSKAKD